MTRHKGARKYIEFQFVFIHTGESHLWGSDVKVCYLKEDVNDFTKLQALGCIANQLLREQFQEIIVK